jgi:hypothetical protein
MISTTASDLMSISNDNNLVFFFISLLLLQSTAYMPHTINTAPKTLHKNKPSNEIVHHACERLKNDKHVMFRVSRIYNVPS